MMKQYVWMGVMVCWLGFAASGCTVKQQESVLGSIGTVIPGSKGSMFGGTSDEPGATAPQAAVAARVEVAQTDAQLVLQTFQRAMKDNPLPFQECLDESRCRLALTAHLISLQEQAVSTLELPPLYDRYDLKRGK
jgi:hypothetical protein